MAIREITVAGTKILVEVVEMQVEGESGFEFTGQDEYKDISDRISDLVGVLTSPVQAAFKGSGAEEWSLELSLGFKAEGGVPFIAKSEANAAVKVTAKWKKGG